MDKLGISRHPSARAFLASASKEFNISQPQFYFPGFDVITSGGDVIYSPETILNNKYKVVNIDYLIDKELDLAQHHLESISDNTLTIENTDSSSDEHEISTEHLEELYIKPCCTTAPVDKPCCTTTPVDKPCCTTAPVDEPSCTTAPVDEPCCTTTPVEGQDDGEWTDCSSESNEKDTEGSESVMSEYDLLGNNNLDIADEDFTPDQLRSNMDISEQAKFFEQVRPIDKSDNTDNCFSLMATIQKTHKGTIKTYHQKIFCKKAPLIEPLKAIDPSNYPDLITTANQGTVNNILLPDPNTKKIFDKLNSIHNTTHVETLALYTLSKLTELGKCPTFPYYFGSVQGIMPVHYHNITDEIPDYAEYDWFNELLEDGKIDVLYIDISEYANSGREILRSEDICLDILDTDLPSEDEIKPFKRQIDELTTEYETLFETLTDDSNVDEFISTGRLPSSSNTSTQDDLKRSQPSTARIEFEDLDEIDIDELKPDDIIPVKKFEHKLFYLKLPNFPVSLSFMEKMIGSLDDDMNATKPMTEQQLLSVLFQVAFGLAVANKHLRFVHNDLHAGNIMFQSTPQKYLYYSIHGNYYRIPTYNKIAKIIDFARAVIKINDKWIVSDAFEPDNDAGEQYAMPDSEGKYSKATFNEDGDKLPRPNPSFDLSLLATILTHYASDNISDSAELVNMLNHWATDKHGINHAHSAVDFSLYTNIARDCHNAIPKDVLKHKLFQQFKIQRKQIPKRQFIYKF